jgi:hypothetical protein
VNAKNNAHIVPKLKKNRCLLRFFRARILIRGVDSPSSFRKPRASSTSLGDHIVLI